MSIYVSHAPVNCLRTFPVDQLPFVGHSKNALSLHPIFDGSVWKGVECTHSPDQPSPHLTGTHIECKRHVVGDEPELRHRINTYNHKSYGVHCILTPLKLSVIERSAKGIKFEGGDSYELPEDLPVEEGEEVITLSAVKEVLPRNQIAPGNVLVLQFKKGEQYFSNWPYLTNEATKYLVALNFSSFVSNVPSVDRERDGGLTSNHKILFQKPSRLIVESADLSGLTVTGKVVVEISVDPQKILTDCASLTELNITPEPTFQGYINKM